MNRLKKIFIALTIVGAMLGLSACSTYGYCDAECGCPCVGVASDD